MPDLHSPSSAITHAGRALTALFDALPHVETKAPREPICAANARGHYRPDEEAELIAWFARFLTLREGLWQVIEEVSEPLDGDLDRIESDDHWRLFLLGYAAACAVVRLDRLLVEDVAAHTVTQRKLNEGDLERRIPRKQYTDVFESLTEPRKALMLARAMKLAHSNRVRLEAFSTEPSLARIGAQLPGLESALDSSRRRYLRLASRFGEHYSRRLGASIKQHGFFAVLESAGRSLAEIRDHWSEKRVTAQVRELLRKLLRPGDVLVTRHDTAMTNLFLPGYWPHAALFIGTEAQRDAMGIDLDTERERRWSGDRCVLEALKDGVRFRPLEETLAVDAVAVIRPILSPSRLARGIERVCEHEGKLYNFDFDFFRSDRLVCTEVVYRAFDGIDEGFQIELRERSGRPTLSAEDLLDLALVGQRFQAIALFGAPGVEGLATDNVESILAATYREGASSG